jgi:hypothetical protein
VLDQEARDAFKVGDNVLAVHCHQTDGGQFIDVGLESMLTGTAATLVPDARQEAAAWKFTTDDPGTSNWASPAFDDAGWSMGMSGFGGTEPSGAPVTSPWATSDIWLRKTFTVEDTGFSNVYVNIFHDEDAMVAINGQTVLLRAGYVTDYVQVDVTAAAKAVLVKGDNVIAVYCHQIDGGQFIDVGLQVVTVEPPVRVTGGSKRTARTAEKVRYGRNAPLFSARPGSGRLFQADGKAALIR